MEKVREIKRDELSALLAEWWNGAINEREVHERAEAWVDEFGELPNYNESDPRSIAAEVLLQLDILNHQLITPEDIYAIERFLNTPLGGELEAWSAWRRYWDQLDFETRKEKLKANLYYCT